MESQAPPSASDSGIMTDEGGRIHQIIRDFASIKMMFLHKLIEIEPLVNEIIRWMRLDGVTAIHIRL